MITERLVFKNSEKNDSLVAFRHAILDGVEGFYAFVANADLKLEVDKPYDCEVVPMHSRKGFVVKDARAGKDKYGFNLVNKAIRVYRLDTYGVYHITPYDFDPKVFSDVEESVSRLIQDFSRNKLTSFEIPEEEFLMFVEDYQKACSKLYKEYAKKLKQEAKK